MEERLRYEVLQFFKKCRVCKEEFDPPKRVYCSEKCLNIFWSIRSWKLMRMAMYKRYAGLCGICWKPLRTMQYEIDHVIPRALGGSEYGVFNLRPVHKKCHREKTKRDLKKIALMKKIPIPTKKPLKQRC